MSDAAAPEDSANARKKSKWPMIVALLVAPALGGAGFYASWTGLIFGAAEDHSDSVTPAALPEIAFVAIDPIVISLPPGGQSRHLKFTAQLEVAKPLAPEVTMLTPRIMDVMNSYLRAIDLAQIEDPGAMTRLRAQMLRRVQIVTGEGRVRDLLITEFLLD